MDVALNRQLLAEFGKYSASNFGFCFLKRLNKKSKGFCVT